ncbi:hypothetical protein RDV64_03460 [Acuticoccus sp. MNP-M23]|uniref:hypothetical protein n=1 Tax=Acuticoccus sp. MNP-M23 TaxID=3072793 RepID=UPI0028165E08|nr:hypothetical protein [Acuticoccus sp. MNP-M23]WMS43472.1 hypothetical protein RDV64_03460 [Acuticoccus sp. MNP-M23]
MSPLAYSIADTVWMSGLGRTKLFTEITTGRLPAKKFGSRTVVLADDLKAYLDALPRAVRRVDADRKRGGCVMSMQTRIDRKAFNAWASAIGEGVVEVTAQEGRNGGGAQ